MDPCSILVRTIFILLGVVLMILAERWLADLYSRQQTCSRKIEWASRIEHYFAWMLVLVCLGGLVVDRKLIYFPGFCLGWFWWGIAYAVLFNNKRSILILKVLAWVRLPVPVVGWILSPINLWLIAKDGK